MTTRPFELHSQFPPAGDQPETIRALVAGLRDDGLDTMTLLGVTGSGKIYIEKDSSINDHIEQCGR